MLAALILFFPESPRWLIDHGHSEKGLRTLARLHANGNVDDAWVRAEYAQIQVCAVPPLPPLQGFGRAQGREADAVSNCL